MHSEPVAGDVEAVVQHLDVGLTFYALAAGALGVDVDEVVDAEHDDQDGVGDSERPGSREHLSEV